MTTIPDYFLDVLIYKNYENRSRDTFCLDPQPCRLTALYAELLHVTIAQRQLWSANLACSFEPFSWLCDEDDLLIAVAILVSQGKLIVDKPLEKYEQRKKAVAQLDIWENKLKEAKNMIAAWKRRLRGDEDAIAQATIHPHLVDACNPNPESDA